MKFTPLGGSFPWRISPAQLASSVANLCKDRNEGSGGDQPAGCGTCALGDYPVVGKVTHVGREGPEGRTDDEDHDDVDSEILEQSSVVVRV